MRRGANLHSRWKLWIQGFRQGSIGEDCKGDLFVNLGDSTEWCLFFLERVFLRCCSLIVWVLHYVPQDDHWCPIIHTRGHCNSLNLNDQVRELCQHVSRKKIRSSKPHKTISDPEPCWGSALHSQPQGKKPTVTEKWLVEVRESLAALEDIFDWRVDSDGNAQYGKPTDGHWKALHGITLAKVLMCCFWSQEIRCLILRLRILGRVGKSPLRSITALLSWIGSDRRLC